MVVFRHCSECALSSGSDSDVKEVARGLLITSEGRRQTQRRHKPPEKLMSTMLYNQHQARKRKVWLLQLFSELFILLLFDGRQFPIKHSHRKRFLCAFWPIDCQCGSEAYRRGTKTELLCWKSVDQKARKTSIKVSLKYLH